MRITANQLTTLRILFIPLPCALLLTGGFRTQMVAWALYVIVGITDFFDGILARKYGSTKLGALLDPIADKIYVTLLFLPLSILGLLPVWMVVAIIIRDPVITCMRSLSQMRGIVMKTSTLAKYKTAIQMIAGGYIIWSGLIVDRKAAVAGMASVVVIAWLLFFLYVALKRRFSLRLFTLGALPSLGLGIRALFDAHDTCLAYGWLTFSITWLSAAYYIVLFILKYRGGKGRIGPLWWLYNLLESFAFPLLVLLFQGREGIPEWVPMTIICLEFSGGALDNLVTSENMLRSAPGVGIKMLLELAVAVLIALKLWLPSAVPAPLDHPVWVDAYALLGVALVSFLLFFASHGIKVITEKPA